MEHYKNLSLENLTEEIEGIVYEEEWRDVVGWEGRYQCSSFGRVKCIRDAKRNVKIRIMQQSLKATGYLTISLCKNGVYEYYRTHRLVGIAFIKNELNKPYINHINAIKHQNIVSNLEWATSKENSEHAVAMGLMKSPKHFLGKCGEQHHRSMKIIQFDTDGGLIKIHHSMNMAAEETKIPQANIWKVCAGQRKTAGGFKWQYV